MGRGPGAVKGGLFCGQGVSGCWLAGVPGWLRSSLLARSQPGRTGLSERGTGPGCAPESTAAHELLLLCSRQEVLKEHLEKVLICEWKNWGTSPYHTFLDLFQVNARRQL